MADVAKWLRQWIVTPPVAGSTPVIRLFLSSFYKKVPLIGFEPIRPKVGAF